MNKQYIVRFKKGYPPVLVGARDEKDALAQGMAEFRFHEGMVDLRGAKDVVVSVSEWDGFESASRRRPVSDVPAPDFL